MFKRFLSSLVILAAVIGVSACSTQQADKMPHRMVLHLDENNVDQMNLVLNNASNVASYYLEKGEEVQVEVVAYGPGLNMLVPGKSPVEQRVASVMENFEQVKFKACGNTIQKMEKKSGKTVQLAPNVEIVPAGVVWLAERQEQGWSYVRP